MSNDRILPGMYILNNPLDTSYFSVLLLGLEIQSKEDTAPSLRVLQSTWEKNKKSTSRKQHDKHHGKGIITEEKRSI